MLAAIVKAITARSYEVYARPYELNIIGIRSDNTAANQFDDELHIFYRNSVQQWVHAAFTVTTDPGTFWLKSPIHPKGTAILAGGQYRGAYQIGLHQGKYYALVQRKPVTVLRDYDRNAILDFKNGTPDTGMFGINIHRASVSGTTKEIDRYSAGCQVFANVNDFNAFMQLCERHRQLYGNSFTYTLIDKRAIARSEKKKLAISLAGVSIGIGTSIIMYQILKP